MIPDVVDKCTNSHYGKKAIVLYTAGVMEVVQMRLVITTCKNISVVVHVFLIWTEYTQLHIKESIQLHMECRHLDINEFVQLHFIYTDCYIVI